VFASQLRERFDNHGRLYLSAYNMPDLSGLEQSGSEPAAREEPLPPEIDDGFADRELAALETSLDSWITYQNLGDGQNFRMGPED
jgi:hypothetical protein